MDRHFDIGRGLAILAALSAGTALGACSAKEGQYPSFVIPSPSEDGARVAMRFPDVAVPEPGDARAVVEPLPQELDARLDSIDARAARAASGFAARLPAARASAAAARGAEAGSERWAQAQLDLASLVSDHSQGALALADLDQLASQAQINLAKPKTLSEIQEMQEQLAATLEEQARDVATLKAQVEG